jgi:dihydrofolate reductase
MELVVNTFLTVDGVFQGPGGRDEDRSGGFDRGGWLAPHFDGMAGQFMDRVFDRVDAFLLGRRTYDIFASYWPNITDPDNKVANRLNNLPKHVASTTLKRPEWNNASVIEGDLAAGVRKLKQQEGRELQVHGSGRLVQFLLDNDLVDRLNLQVFPVILGAGRRFFAESGIATRLELEESQTTGSGVTISSYRTKGRPEFRDVDDTD